MRARPKGREALESESAPGPEKPEKGAIERKPSGNEKNLSKGEAPSS